MIKSNEELREYANQLAARLAAKLNKPAPKCTRITRRRGYAYPWRGQFSVPRWALDAHPAYATYYVLHEACHCFSNTCGHGPEFLHLEATLLEEEGIRIIRRSKNCYAKSLVDIATGATLCGIWGE